MSRLHALLWGRMLSCGRLGAPSGPGLPAAGATREERLHDLFAGARGGLSTRRRLATCPTNL